MAGCRVLYYISFLHVCRLCAFVSIVIPILELMVARCTLTSLLYLCEVAEGGSVLAGVELELPEDGSGHVHVVRHL